MGTYTSFAFTPNDDAVIIWAAGQIYRVPITTNARGEKVRADQPHTIPFTALIELRLADTQSYETSVDLLNLETQDTSRVYAFKELRVDEEGKRAIFNAASVTVVQDIGKSNITKVPVLDASAPYYFPSFVPGTSGNVLVHARWSDTKFTSFEVADLRSGKAYEIVGVPLGRYRSPVFAASQKKLAFVKLANDYLSGNIVATANPGLYIADVDVSGLKESATSSKLNVTNLQFIPSDVDPSDRIQLRFIEDTKLSVRPIFSIEHNGTSQPTRTLPVKFLLHYGKG
ncbi:hypothetical protein MPER_06866 [Moniliophthora perniciosa FA553]|nr:hypothetical protein MPER_06866 [Moniliophthora perniciosa FA553]